MPLPIREAIGEQARHDSETLRHPPDRSPPLGQRRDVIRIIRWMYGDVPHDLLGVNRHCGVTFAWRR